MVEWANELLTWLPNWMNRILIFWYAAMMTLYILGGNWNKALYWLGAALLATAIVRMK